MLPLLHRGRCRSIATVDKALILKYSLYLANKFLCTLTHNSPRCSLLRNGAQTDRRNASSPLCFPWRSLPSPSRPKLRLSSQLTHQYRAGPRPFSGLIGQHAHGWRQLELPPLNHQLLAAFAVQPIRAMHVPPCSRSAAPDGATTHILVRRLAQRRHEQLSTCRIEPAGRSNAPGDWPDACLGLGQREVGRGERWRCSAGAGGGHPQPSTSIAKPALFGKVPSHRAPLSRRLARRMPRR